MYVSKRLWEICTGVEGERESQAGSFLSTEPNLGPDSMTVRPWPKPKLLRQTLNQLSHPGTPNFFKCKICSDNSFFKNFIYLFDRQRSQFGREAGGEWERRKQAPRWAESPMRGSIPGPWDHDPSRRQRLQPTEPPSFLCSDNSLFISDIGTEKFYIKEWSSRCFVKN